MSEKNENGKPKRVPDELSVMRSLKNKLDDLPPDSAMRVMNYLTEYARDRLRGEHTDAPLEGRVQPNQVPMFGK